MRGVRNRRNAGKILLLVMVTAVFAGCATDYESDNQSWADAKKHMESTFGQNSSQSMGQQMQGFNSNQ